MHASMHGKWTDPWCCYTSFLESRVHIGESAYLRAAFSCCRAAIFALRSSTSAGAPASLTTFFFPFLSALAASLAVCLTPSMVLPFFCFFAFAADACFCGCVLRYVDGCSCRCWL